ncbi:MAG: hypothetical protein F8N39_11615 [Clostridiaceae bacterium]|nr:hypothetical protein [Clostridiaceae bacterium]
MNVRKLAGAMSFAHLAGLGRAKSKVKSEEDGGEDRRADAEDDEPEQDDQDQENGNGKKSKKAKRAEDDDEDSSADENEDDESAEDEDPNEEGEPKSRKAKKAKRAEDDDDGESAEDDEDGKPQGSFRRGRKAERARWAKVMGSQFAARNLPMACNMLARTGMSASSILGVLRDTPSASTSGDRASRNPNLGVTGERSPTSAASRWDAVMQRVRGK